MMTANCKRSRRSSACRLENFSRLRGVLRPRSPFFGASRQLPDRLGEGPSTEPMADTRACGGDWSQNAPELAFGLS